MAYSDEGRNRKRMGGRFADITLSFVILTFPMAIFTALILGLVFGYRVTHNNPPFPHLQLEGTTDEAGIYYINLNSTFLVFIASWSSSLAPLLISFILVLATYPICRQYLVHARGNLKQDLLTPYQLALTLRFLNGGGLGALWSWIKYHFGWKHVRQPQGSVLSKTALVTILGSTLAIAVFLADTWLHVTTKTVEFIQILPAANTSSDYSFIINPNCTYSNNSMAVQEYPQQGHCSYHVGGYGCYFTNSTQSLQVLNNISDVASVFTYGISAPYTYLGVPESQSSERDYTATTFGMQTTCKPIAEECNLNGGSDIDFYCSEGLQGVIGASPFWESVYFTDSTMSSNDTVYRVNNPYYFAIVSAQSAGVQNAGLVTNENPAPGTFGILHGGIGFILSCSATLYDIEYDSINGTITRFVTTASNTSIANAWEGPVDWIGGDPSATSLQQAAAVAIFSDTAQELADKVAIAYSQTALALGAQSVLRSPAIAVQERQSFLVSRVPAAPLYILVATNLAFVLFGIFLMGIAIKASGGDVREVQARLSITGLVADRFEAHRGRDGVENMDDYFEEMEGIDSMRVAISETDQNGFAYRVLEQTE